MKKLFLLIYIMLLSLCTRAQEMINEDIAHIKNWVVNHKIGKPVHYRYAYQVVLDVNSKQGKSWLKDLQRNSGFDWNYLSTAQGGIIVPSKLYSDFTGFSNNNAMEYNNANFKRHSIRTYLPSYSEDKAIQYDISLSQFTDFQEFMDSYKAEILPFSFASQTDPHNNAIPSITRTSKKGYPYYGKVTILLKDAQNREVDSFGYIYSTTRDLKPWGEEVVKEFKANVSTNATVAYFDIYCNGEKVSSPTYTTTAYSTTSFETNPGNEGLGFVTSLLQIAMTTYLQKTELNSYQEEIFRLAQQKTCFYSVDQKDKTEQNSKIYLEQAKTAFDNNNYYEAVQKANASIWAKENLDARILLGEIMERFNIIDQSLVNYVEAISIAKSNVIQNRLLGELYFRVSRCISKLESPTQFRWTNNQVVVVRPEIAVDYLKKSAAAGFSDAKVLVANTAEAQLLETLSKMK